MTTNADNKPRKTRAEIRAIRSAAGKKGAAAKHGRGRSIATLEKEAIKKAIDQRAMRATDRLMNGQISLATGQQFLYRIKKTWVEMGKLKRGQADEGNQSGYWRNEKPELVTSQWEIEQYLEELAENNGELDDDKDGGDTYYYITTKEPNNQAIDSLLNRVHGKPKDDNALAGLHAAFSLLELARRSTSLAPINGNADVQTVELAPKTLPHPRPSSEE